MRLARCPKCGELDVTYLRPDPDATVSVRWQFRRDGETFAKPPGCEHLIVDGIEVRAVSNE
jgi:uncharacterized C2H2 Zn-finger protein